MTSWLIASVIGCFGLFLLNFWAKSILVSIATLLLSIWIMFQFDSNNYTQIYYYGASWFMITWNIYYMMFKTENL